ncbi:MAG: Rossmann-like and DUF2520 domain-containing protein [Flavobacteriales bacterium]
MKEIKTITFIGAGNVATHLAKALYKANISINQVYSKSFKNANALAKKVNAQPIENLSQLNTRTDLIIIAVPDDTIETVVKNIAIKDKLMVHTSGSVDLGVFKKGAFKSIGIFYPLQTFSKSKALNLQEVPICIEANSKSNLALLNTLANKLSNKVYEISSVQRQQLHLAAVFACNFSNNMYQIAFDICRNNNIDFNILKPLIKETAQKIETIEPKLAQTGPAKRNDASTILKHLDLLQNQKNYQDIYQLITQNIQKDS